MSAEARGTRARRLELVRVIRTTMRARRAQLTLLTLAVAGVVAVAGLLPLVTASIGRAMVDHRVQQLGSTGRSVEVRVLSQDGLVPTSRIASLLDDGWDGVAGPPVGQYRVVTSAIPTDLGRQVTLLDRQGQCEHIRLVSGSCPQGRFQVAISSESARTWGLVVGSRPRVTQGSTERLPVNRTLTVVGIFESDPKDAFWRGLDVGSVPKKTAGGEDIERHTWLTGPASFGGPAPSPRPASGQEPGTAAETAANVGWSRVETTVSRPLVTGAFSYDRLDEARTALRQTEGRIAAQGTSIELIEQVSALDRLVGDDIEQLRVIGPVLIAQLLVLQSVLAWIVLRALLTQRRTEVALIRLRSPARSGAATVLRGELLPAVLLGLPVGLAGSFVMDWLIRSVWLSGTASGGWSNQALVACLVAFGVCLAASLWMVRRLVRQPIWTLLRSVPPRTRRWSLSAAEIVLLTVAFGLVAAVLAGSLSGPAVLLTPVAAAVAVGLVVSGLLAPLGNRLAARFLHRGRVPQLLAMTSLARRPSSRYVLLALTAAGAMITFAVSTVQLGTLNRVHLAQATNGASVRLVADSADFLEPSRVVGTINRLDPEHRSIAPVLRIRSGSSDGPVTVAADPRAMSRLAERAGGGDPWSTLRDAGPAEAPAVVAGWSRPGTESSFTAPSLGGADRTYTAVGTVPFIPGAGEHGFITPLQPLLAGAAGSGFVTVEVWSDGSDPALLTRAREAVTALGYQRVTEVRTADQVEDLDHSASAYGLQLGVLVAAGALFVGLLVLIAVLSTQRPSRRSDLAALRSAGVPSGPLRRARIREATLLVGPLFLGGVTGWLGAWLAAPSIPWFAADPGFDVAGRVPPLGWAAASLGLAVAVSLLVTLAGLRASTEPRR